MSKLAKKLYLELSHACADNPPPCSEPAYQDWFFPEGFIPTKGISTAAYQSRVRLTELAAKQLCNSCPIKQLCASYAIAGNEEWGIWGSTTPAERRAISSSVSNKPEPTTAIRSFD